MADAPLLATIADLAAYVQEDIADGDAPATLSLEIASGVLRSYLGYDVLGVDDFVELCDPINASFIELRQTPVKDVTLVEVFNRDANDFVIVASTDYDVSLRLGVIAGHPGTGFRWPSWPESWRVTYSYGYDTVPDAIRGVCVGIAARQWATPVGIESERIGGYNVRFADRHDDALTPIEKLALRAYLRPSIA
jgi:hypothetical protein